ncbi:MAG: HAD hydrolase-like protein [Fuerstiella sp.]
MRSILVLSGGTRREDLRQYAFRPDRIVESIADLEATEAPEDVFSPAAVMSGITAGTAAADERSFARAS